MILKQKCKIQRKSRQDKSMMNKIQGKAIFPLEKVLDSKTGASYTPLWNRCCLSTKSFAHQASEKSKEYRQVL